MVFEWFRNHKRDAILAEPFPAAWLTVLERNVLFYNWLTEDEQARLRDITRILIAEKNWEGCGGLAITDEMQVTIAAQAALLILNRPHHFYDSVESILVYPSDFIVRDLPASPDGVIMGGGARLLGEANLNGPILLSWEDALAGGRNPDDGHNVTLHEFAHKIDMNDGDPNGVPLLDDETQVETWEAVMSREYETLVADTEKGRPSLLDHYGATNAAEFFAVATECFFEKPEQMRETHVRLYDTLKGYYHHDPATWKINAKAALHHSHDSRDVSDAAIPASQDVESASVSPDAPESGFHALMQHLPHTHGKKHKVS